ncbi:MAG: hypothetical protein GF331_02435, partial [Chitinivibrionales bacterium]|nr:hypothetical protein [Chitinivibrionales bacterium]
MKDTHQWALLLLVGGVALHAQTYDPAPNWEHRTHSNGQWYDLYVPDPITPDQTCPMVLALHGCCGDGVNYGEVTVGGDPIYRAWHNHARNTQAEPTFIVAPGISSNWGNYRTRVMEILRDLIDEFPIDTQRIIITGFSMGGAGVFNYISADPSFFSAALPIAAAVSGAVNGELIKHVPTWGGVGDDDGWKDEHMMTVTPVRAALGDDRGAATYVTGVNPRFDIYPNTGHGPGMEGLYTQAEVIPWALSRVNDGNNYPLVRFTQSAPGHGETLPAATTSVTVIAHAQDDGGAITSVAFFLDGQPVTVDSDAPYEATVSGLTPGDHVIEATATDNGTAQGYALDKTATATLKFSIASTPQIGESSVPPAARGVFYRHSIELVGGNAPFSWSATGGALPQGLQLYGNGTIEGIATVTGAYSISATVIDRDGDSHAASLSLTVGEAPAGVVVVSNIVENARAIFIPGLCAEGEPYEITGYGYPAGEFHLGNYNPVYDVLSDVAGLEGSTLFRATTLAGDISTDKDTMLAFDISHATTVHVACPRKDDASFPSWLATMGFVATGDTLRAERQDFIDFAKDYPAGRVVLPGY